VGAGSKPKQWGCLVICTPELVPFLSNSHAATHLSCLCSSVPKSVKSARDFTPEALNAVLVNAMRLIAPDEATTATLVEKLPANVAARHRVATAVANAIKAAGYGGEGGYNSLLYPNERDVRRLLSWVVQRIPRAEDAAGGEGGAGGGLFGSLLAGLGPWLAGNTSTRGVAGGSSPQLMRAAPRRVLAAHEHQVAAAAIFTAASTPSSSGASASAGGTLSPRPGKAGASSSAAAAAVANMKEAIAAAARTEGARAPTDAAFLLALGEREAVRAAFTTSSTGQPSPSSSSSSSSASSASGAASSDASVAADAAAAVAAIPFPPLERVAEALAASRSVNGGASSSAAGSHFPGTHLDSYPCAFSRRAAFAIQVTRVVAPPPAAAPVAAAVEAPKAKTEEEIHREREEEIARLTDELEAAGAAAEALASKRALLSSMLPQIRTQLAAVAERAKELERGYLVRKAGLDMLPNAAEHLPRLAAELDAASARLVALGAEWEQYRGPIMAAVLAEEARGTAQQERAEKLQADMADMRAQASGLASEVAAKEEQERRLTTEVGKLQAAMAAAGNGPDAIITRPVYTRRILDIVRQIRKQKSEIARIVGDVRTVQADLAAVSDRVRKTASAATEAMDKAAAEHAKDPAYRNSLRLVLALQDAFDGLLAAVTAIGQAENETRDIDNRIEQMAQRDDAANMAKLAGDIAAIRQENAALQQQLGAASAAAGGGGR
jgi:hypothetical protein